MRTFSSVATHGSATTTPSPNAEDVADVAGVVDEAAAGGEGDAALCAEMAAMRVRMLECVGSRVLSKGERESVGVFYTSLFSFISLMCGSFFIQMGRRSPV